MHECPNCQQACDCDGEDTWIGYPYNLDCVHDCEEDNIEDEDIDDYDWIPEVDYHETTLLERIREWILRKIDRYKPFKCEVCGRWSISIRRPCCSEKCQGDWVPF